MASPRWVTVDDTSSSIQYSGSWTLDNGQNWMQGNFGLSYLNSLHSLKGSHGSLSYTYDGTSGAVYGTTNVVTTAGVQDPTWSCQVDGTTIPLGSPLPYLENNWVLCSWSNLPAGKHTVTVTATSSSQAFLFDRFQYIASPDSGVANVDMQVSQNDAAIQYGSGWSNLGTIGKMAVSAGSVVTFPFYGTGISWWSDAPTELPHGPTTAQYTIDGGSPTTFTVPGVVGSNTQYYQLLFDVGSLSLGQHTLQVTSKGSTSVTPLVLSGLTIKGGAVKEPAALTPVVTPPVTDTSTTTTTTTTGSGTSTSTSTTSGSGTSQTTSTTASDSKNFTSTGDSTIPSTSTGTAQNAASTPGATSGTTLTLDGTSKHSAPIGAIVGSVIGGLLLILLLIFAFMCLRRKRRMQNLHKRALEAQPFNPAQSPRRSYSDSASTSALPTSNEVVMESPFAAFEAQQMSQVGSSGAFASKYAERANNLRSGSTSVPTDSRTSASNHGSNPYSISNFSEVSSPGSSGSAATFLRPIEPDNYTNGTSKQQEYVRYSRSPSLGGTDVVSRVINHQDSGYRLPRAEAAALLPTPEEVIEYPPEYSAS